jgi:hypothetical protein
MAERQTYASQLSHSEKRYAQLVISGGDPSVTFQLTKEAFDEVPLPV